MQNKVPTFLEKYKQEKELRQLQMQLDDKVHELQSKEAKIIELENFISQVQNTSTIKDKFKEDQTQCSFDQDSIKQQADLIRRLGEVLSARQQQGMGLHLASREIEEENAKLKLTLQKKDDQLLQTKGQLNVVEGYLQIGMKDLEFLCNQNRDLKDRVAQLEIKQMRKNDEVLQLQRIKKSLEITRSQKGMLQQQLKTEEQKNNQLKKQMERMRNQLEIQVNQLQQTKGALNSYDWKLFCLQTELDLLAKQRKQLKFLNQKLQVKIAEMQVTFKQQRTAVFSSEEEIRLLQSQNRFLRGESERNQEKMEKLLIELDIMRQNMEQQDQIKQLEYRLKEKDEELNQIAQYLKQKIAELDQVKHRSALIDKKIHQIQKSLQKKQNQNYELQQSITENQQILQKQSSKIQELQKNLQITNKMFENESILTLLRASEWNQLNTQLEQRIESQQKKINELSVEIIERDIAAHKQAEKLNKTEVQLERVQEDLVQLYTKLSDMELKLVQSILQKQKLQTELDKMIIKNSQQYFNLFQKQQILHLMRDQLRLQRNQKQRLKQISEDLSKQLSKKIDQIAQLKQMLVQNAQSEVCFERQIEQLQQQIQTIGLQNLQKDIENEQKQVTIQNMKREAKQLKLITQIRIQEMAEVISQSIQNSEPNEQTTKFELMDQDEQNFQVMECKVQKQKIQLKAKIDQYKSQVISIMKAFD